MKKFFLMMVISILVVLGTSVKAQDTAKYVSLLAQFRQLDEILPKIAGLPCFPARPSSKKEVKKNPTTFLGKEFAPGKFIEGVFHGNVYDVSLTRDNASGKIIYFHCVTEQPAGIWTDIDYTTGENGEPVSLKITSYSYTMPGDKNFVQWKLNELFCKISEPKGFFLHPKPPQHVWGQEYDLIPTKIMEDLKQISHGREVVIVL